MSVKSRIITIGLLVVLMTVFLTSTNPNGVSIALLAVPVMIVAVIIYQITRVLLSLFRILTKSERKRQIVSIAFASFVTGVFILQSIGGLTAGDITLLVSFGAVSVFYLAKLL